MPMFDESQLTTYAASNSPNLKRVANCHYTATYSVPDGQSAPSPYEDDTDMDFWLGRT